MESSYIFFKDWAITNLLAELVFVSREYVGTNDRASLVLMILMDNASSFDLQNPQGPLSLPQCHTLELLWLRLGRCQSPVVVSCLSIPFDPGFHSFNDETSGEWELRRWRSG
jgi:hypothetical protein